MLQYLQGWICWEDEEGGGVIHAVEFQVVLYFSLKSLRGPIRSLVFSGAQERIHVLRSDGGGVANLLKVIMIVLCCVLTACLDAELVIGVARYSFIPMPSSILIYRRVWPLIYSNQSAWHPHFTERK